MLKFLVLRDYFFIMVMVSNHESVIPFTHSRYCKFLYQLEYINMLLALKSKGYLNQIIIHEKQWSLLFRSLWQDASKYVSKESK